MEHNFSETANASNYGKRYLIEFLSLLIKQIRISEIKQPENKKRNYDPL